MTADGLTVFAFRLPRFQSPYATFCAWNPQMPKCECLKPDNHCHALSALPGPISFAVVPDGSDFTGRCFSAQTLMQTCQLQPNLPSSVLWAPLALGETKVLNHVE